MRIFTGNILLSITLSTSFLFAAQSVSAQSYEEEENEKGAQKFTFGLGHVYFQKGAQTEGLKESAVGAYTLNYDYLFNSRWSIGSHNDIIIEDIKKHEGSELLTEHERPVAAKLVGSYRPTKHAGIMFGIGEELAHSDSYFLSTVGLDYGWHLSKGWELGGEVTYDVKWHSTDSWIVGIGISKLISRHHKG